MQKRNYLVILVVFIFLIGGVYAISNFNVINNTINNQNSSIDIANNSQSTIDVNSSSGGESTNLARDYHALVSKPTYHDVNGPFNEKDIGKIFVDEDGQEYMYVGNYTYQEVCEMLNIPYDSVENPTPVNLQLPDYGPITYSVGDDGSLIQTGQRTNIGDVYITS